jgi:phospholipid-binding lipoprotein MlaA
VRPFFLPVIVAIVALQPAAGWAKEVGPTSGTPGDPWEKSNRRLYALNDLIMRSVLRPLSKLTSGLTPGLVGKAIHNFVVNLTEPQVIVNDLLQARPVSAVKSFFRLVVNTTAGGLGAVNVAKAIGVPYHPNGFGDTLGRWGVGPGPYLLIPVAGPSTIRDLFGTVADDATLPLKTVSYPYRTVVEISTTVVGGLNQFGEAGKDLDALLSGAADPYATLRSAYLQSREAQIRGQKVLPALPDIEEVPSQTAPDAASPPVDGATPPAPAPSTPDPATPPTAAAPDFAPPTL